MKLSMNVLNFKEYGRFQQIDGTNKTYNSVFVSKLVITNPDKHCTWSKVSLKQIVLRLGTSYGIYHS